EAVQALPGAHVACVGEDGQLVALGEAGEGETRTVPGARVDLPTVETDLVHGVGDEVDEGAGAVGGGEGDRGSGGEDPVPAGEVEVDVVGLDVDERGTVRRLLAGEVLSGHGLSFCGRGGGRPVRSCHAGL